LILLDKPAASVYLAGRTKLARGCAAPRKQIRGADPVPGQAGLNAGPKGFNPAEDQPEKEYSHGGTILHHAPVA
jgi:hypothetical protein